MKIQLKRIDKLDKCTIGILFVNDMEFCTLELPWRDNKPNVSCIPAGLYTVSKRYTDKYKHHFIIQDVPGREAILVHKGNTFEHTHGCILVGMALGDVNGDNVPDVIRSGEAMQILNQVITEPCVIEIG